MVEYNFLFYWVLFIYWLISVYLDFVKFFIPLPKLFDPL